ncbi:predicted protein [Histoplasma capsulatum G186AR]|uniref:Uncharacterized protein n=1 Tax=Ajellomyces capsulatus (strain G186AR / H82 / ATCC MYA-2454 / RMSCC 2432) TaxID=447093 RepID=C0P0V5_AJECG|nr:uncharacterized protein HCBG_09035 [Histoplasma capsulatum G186AR]EEH02755.1 predicted protein [Histoplasma capsulatum G186AR]
MDRISTPSQQSDLFFREFRQQPNLLATASRVGCVLALFHVSSVLHRARERKIYFVFLSAQAQQANDGLLRCPVRVIIPCSYLIDSNPVIIKLVVGTAPETLQ